MLGENVDKEHANDRHEKLYCTPQQVRVTKGEFGVQAPSGTVGRTDKRTVVELSDFGPT